MKLQIKFTTIATAAFIVLFTSCKSDNSSDTTTVKQDKDNIQASLDAVNTDLKQIKEGSFYEATTSYLGVKDGEVLNSDWGSDMGNAFGDVIDGDALLNNNRLNFTALSGKYTWNPGSASWTKTANKTVLVLFPSSKTSTTNNCEFGITSYTDKLLTTSDKSIYLPTDIKAYLKKDNIEIMSLGFIASFNSNNYLTNASLQLYLKPVTITSSFARVTNAQYSIGFSLQNENEKQNGLSVHSVLTLSKEIGSYSDLENSDVEINNIQLELTKGNLSVKGSIDVKKIRELDDLSPNPTAVDMNKTLNLEVFYNNHVIGNLIFEDAAGDLAMFIVYKDGTKENTSVYYEDFAKNLESVLESDVNAKKIKTIIRNQIIKAKIQKLSNKVLFWKK